MTREPASAALVLLVVTNCLEHNFSRIYSPFKLCLTRETHCAGMIGNVSQNETVKPDAERVSFFHSDVDLFCTELSKTEFT